MSAFLMLYLITISLELVLSLVMALFLFLIVAPAGSVRQPVAAPAAGVSRSPARTLDGALADAFAAVAQGRDDLHAITHARAMLARYAREGR